MNEREALLIVETLNSGINPKTGEQLAGDSVFQDPAVIRALFVARDVLRRRVMTLKRREHQPENTGRLWNREQDERLIAEFEAGRSITEISVQQSRTIGAVVARLMKLGRVTVDDVKRAA